jgi:hypothetical protein
VAKTSSEVRTESARKTYVLEGTILEACSCNVLCPCWVGEDPDGGTCDALLAYHIERGEITGVDVSGLTVLSVARLPGNVFKGGMRRVIFLDESATPEQVRALTDCFQGRLGGPVADVVQILIGEDGEELGVVQAPIRYALEEGDGTLEVGGRVKAAMTPYRSPYGTLTTLRDSVFSTIPGSPAWVAKATEIDVDLPEPGFKWHLEGTNAIQGEFKFEA